MLNNNISQTFESIIRTQHIKPKPEKGLSIKRPVGYFRPNIIEQQSIKRGRNDERPTDAPSESTDTEMASGGNIVESSGDNEGDTGEGSSKQFNRLNV